MEVDYNHNSNEPIQNGYTTKHDTSTTPVKLCDIKAFIQMDATSLNNNSPVSQRFQENVQGQIGSPRCKQDLQNLMLGKVEPNGSVVESMEDLSNRSDVSSQQIQDYDISDDKMADLDDIDKTITEFSQQDRDFTLNDFGNQVVPGGYSYGYDDSGSNNSASPLLEQQLLNEITSQQQQNQDQQQQLTFMQQLEGSLNHQKAGHDNPTLIVKMEPNAVNESDYSGNKSPSNQLVQVNFNNSNNNKTSTTVNSTPPYLNFTVKNEHSNLFHHFKLTKDKGSSKKQVKANNDHQQQQVVSQAPIQQQQLPPIQEPSPESANLNEMEEEMDFNPEMLEGATEDAAAPYKPGGYACRYCGKVYNSYQYRWCHERAHVAPKNHSCEVCGATFQYLQNLSRHIRQVHKMARPFKCKECGRCCSNEAELAEHALTAHENVEKGKKKETVICPVCGVEYSKKYYIRVHKKFHRGIRYSCQICGRMFTHPQNMWRHYKLHENPEAYKVGCTLCSMFFKSELTLKRHMEAKHPEQSKSDSNATNPASPLPQGHPLTSSPVPGKQSEKEKQFQCDVCSKTFAAKSALYCHFRVHQKNKTVRQYNLHCGVCKKTYKEWGALKKHCEIYHNGEGLEENTLKTPVNLKSPYTEVIQSMSAAGNNNSHTNITYIQQTQAVDMMQQVQNTTTGNSNSNDLPSSVYGNVQLPNGYTYPITTNQQELSDYSQQGIMSHTNLSTPVKNQQQIPSSPLPRSYASSPLLNKHNMMDQMSEQQALNSPVKQMSEQIALSNSLSMVNSDAARYIDLPVSSQNSGVVQNNPPAYHTATTTVDQSLFTFNNASLQNNAFNNTSSSATTAQSNNLLQAHYASVRTPSPKSPLVTNTQASIPPIEGIFLQGTPIHNKVPTTPTSTTNYQFNTASASLISNTINSQGATNVNSPGTNSNEIQYLNQQQLLNSPIDEAFSPQMMASPDTDSKRKGGRPKGAKNRKKAVIDGHTFFQCHFCDAMFKSRGGIRNHERMHKELNITGPLPGKNKGRFQASQATAQSNPMSVESEYQQALQDIFSSQSQEMTNDQKLIMQGNEQQLGYNPTSPAFHNDPSISCTDSAQQNGALMSFTEQNQQNLNSPLLQQLIQNQDIPTNTSQLHNSNNPVQGAILCCPHPQCKQSFPDDVTFKQHVLLHLQDNLVKDLPVQATGILNETFNQNVVIKERVFSPDNIQSINTTTTDDVKPVISAIMSMANIMNPIDVAQNNNANILNIQHVNQQPIDNSAAPEKDIKSLLSALVTIANNLNPALLKTAAANSMVPAPVYEDKQATSTQLPSLDTLFKTPLLSQQNVNLSESVNSVHSFSSSGSNMNNS